MASTLPNPADCCVVCCENETVEVPGPAGADGSNGAAGTNGVNAFTTTGENFNMPAEGADTASLLVGNSQWMVPTQIVYVQNAGWMEVRSKADSTHVVLRNIENTASERYTDNVAPGTLITSGSTISPGGLQGVNGSDGSNGAAGTNGTNAFTATTADFTQPAELATVNIEVGTSLWAAIGQNVFVEGGGYYVVTAVPDSTHITIRNLEDSSTGAYPDNTAPASNIAFPKDVSPAGIQGPIQNTTNKVVAITYQPAIGDPSPTMAFGAWTTYDLDTLNDPDGIATLVANQFTLEAGRYAVMGAFTIDNCQIRFRIYETVGLSTVLTSLNGTTDQPMILPMFGAIDVGGGNVFELQYYATNPPGTGTFGAPTTVPALDEAYASLFFTRLEA